MRSPCDHRRSESVTAKGCISAESFGPVLCAFHRDLQTAARRRNDIFDSDSVYQKMFPKACAGEHVLMMYCLGQAIDSIKLRLKEKQGDGNRGEKLRSPEIFHLETVLHHHRGVPVGTNPGRGTPGPLHMAVQDGGNFE
jgi:hypothetical protein